MFNTRICAELAIVRHAETQEAGEAIGSKLTEEGEQQALWTAQELEEYFVKGRACRLFFQGTDSCRETAELIGKELKLEVEPAEELIDLAEAAKAGTVNDYAERTSEMLKQIVRTNTRSILVGTTSAIDMITHLLRHEGEFLQNEYNFANYKLGEFRIWSLSGIRRPIDVTPVERHGNSST